jgi:hypothetical protein
MWSVSLSLMLVYCTVGQLVGRSDVIKQTSRSVSFVSQLVRKQTSRSIGNRSNDRRSILHWSVDTAPRPETTLVKYLSSASL